MSGGDETTRRRFLDKVQTSDGCWMWRGAKSVRTGYGSFSIGGKSEWAHRASWRLLRGPIPAGLWVLHTCDVRPCVNPAHLYLGTVADNSRDAVARRRTATGQRNGVHTHPETRRFGQAVGTAKLTEERILEVLTDLAAGTMQSVAASRHGVSRGAVQQILSGRTWSHSEPIRAAIAAYRRVRPKRSHFA